MIALHPRPSQSRGAQIDHVGLIPTRDNHSSFTKACTTNAKPKTSSLANQENRSRLITQLISAGSVYICSGLLLNGSERDPKIFPKIRKGVGGISKPGPTLSVFTGHDAIRSVKPKPFGHNLFQVSAHFDAENLSSAGRNTPRVYCGHQPICDLTVDRPGV